MKKIIHTIRYGVVFAILFLVLFLFAMFQGGFVSWFLFFSFLPIFLYYLLFLIYPLHRWKITRNISPHTVQAGEQVTVTINIHRRLPFPLFYIILEESFPATLRMLDSQNEKFNYLNTPVKLQKNRTVKKMIFPWFSRRIQVTYNLDQLPRGKHWFPMLRIKTGDLFGFVKKEHTFPLAEQLKVYPRRRPITLLESLSSFDQGSVSQEVFNFKQSNIASTIRDYIPGDKFSTIDWKQTARQNMMMTKEFEREENENILIVLDNRHYEGINLLAFEGAVEVSYSLFSTLKSHHIAIDFLTMEIEVGSLKEQSMMRRNIIHEHLMNIQPIANASFSTLLRRTILKTSNLVTIIVTTQLDDELYETVQQLSHQSHRVILILIDSNQAVISREHFIKQLKRAQVSVSVLTERELIEDTLEVNIY